MSDVSLIANKRAENDVRNRSAPLQECMAITPTIYEDKKLNRELWSKLDEYKQCEDEHRAIESMRYHLTFVYSLHKSRIEQAQQLEALRRETVKEKQARRVMQIRMEALEQELVRSERARAELAAVRMGQLRGV